MEKSDSRSRPDRYSTLGTVRSEVVEGLHSRCKRRSKYDIRRLVFFSKVVAGRTPPTNKNARKSRAFLFGLVQN